MIKLASFGHCGYTMFDNKNELTDRVLFQGGIMVYTIDEIRVIIAPIAKKYKLPAVYLFGSYARGTQTKDSDIDLLVDTTGTMLTSLFSLGGLYADLEEAFQVGVDMVTLNSIEQDAQMPSDHRFKDNILRERVNIYHVA